MMLYGSMNQKLVFLAREAGVLIFSRDVADVYAVAFLADPGTTYVEDIRLEASVTYVDGGAVLNASPSYLKYIPVLAISVIVIAIRCILVRGSK